MAKILSDNQTVKVYKVRMSTYVNHGSASVCEYKGLPDNAITKLLLLTTAEVQKQRLLLCNV